jgi:hypothetical protein
MSLFTWSCGLLAVKPKVWTEPDKLFARASLALRVASFGAYDRCVIAERREQTISIYQKNWWVGAAVISIPFNRVVEIDRSFDRWTTQRHPGAVGSWSRTDQLEFFKVSLCLRDPQENLDLFWFSGEGAVETGATGVLLSNDDVVDLSGDQRATSGSYARQLAGFTRTRVHDFPPQGVMESMDGIMN